MSADNILKLTTVSNQDICIACLENTTNRVTCCNAAICNTCYLEWIKVKRQCMHCMEDQCDFDQWINEYRIEPDFNPQEYLHELAQQENGVFHTITNQDFGVNTIVQLEFTHDLGIGFDNLLRAIQQNLVDTSGNQNMVITDPGELPGPNVPVWVYNYTDIYGQIQQTMINYQNLINQSHNTDPNNHNNYHG